LAGKLGGHPVLVVESFVDESQYRGNCYRACGFEAAGPTAGFGRSSRHFNTAHGQPKQLYLREPRPRARAPASNYGRRAAVPVGGGRDRPGISVPLSGAGLGELAGAVERFARFAFRPWLASPAAV
jgi:hypothetical protein